jgi:hypothetical protein
MKTWVTNLGYSYPQLHQVEEGSDCSQFDRLHVNVAVDGVGVDEVFQMLSGREFVIRQRLDGGDLLSLRLDGGPGRGWVGTYSGTRPHVGSVSSASVGSKLLVQVIGAPGWVMQVESWRRRRRSSRARPSRRPRATLHPIGRIR